MRLAMMGEEGESLRVNAKKMRGLFGDRDRNDRYVDDFVRYLEENKTNGTKRLITPTIAIHRFTCL